MLASIVLALLAVLLAVTPAWATYQCFTKPNADSAAFAAQARVFEEDWQTLALGVRGTGVIYSPGACQVTQRAAGANMSVDVTNGCTISVEGTTASVTSGNLVIGAADSTNPRFDLIGATNAGVKTVTAGTPSSSPTPPTIPDNHVPFAWIYVPAGDTAINTNQITDGRPCIPTPGGGGGGGAPSTAGYWTKTSDAGLSNERAMGSLATGLVQNTFSTGEPTTIAPTDDNVVVGNGATWQLKPLPTCSGGTSALTYNVSTNAFGCNTISGTGTVTTTGSPANGDLAAFTGATSISATNNLLLTVISAPSTPATNKAQVYVDSTSKNLAVKDDAGVVKHGVQTGDCAGGDFVKGYSSAGVRTCASPAGSGTVTHASGALTANLPVVGNGTDDLKTVTAAVARTATHLNIDQVTPRGDANYTILATDRLVATSADFTAVRTWTLPAANAVNAGQRLCIQDKFGGLDATNFLTVLRAGSDTINGGTTFDLKTAYAEVCLTSDGTSVWTRPIGGDVSAGTLTTNTVPKASGAKALTDSLLADNGTTLEYTGTGGITAPALNLNGAGATLLAFTAGTAPSTPASGKGNVYVDSTSKNLAVKDDAGVVKHGVQTTTCTLGDFVSGVSSAGVFTCGTPAGGGGPGATYAIVASDVVNATNSTTLTNVTGLTFNTTASATELWHVDILAKTHSNTSCGSAGRFKFGWTVSGAQTIRWAGNPETGSASGAQLAAGTEPAGTLPTLSYPSGGNITGMIRLVGLVRSNSAAGAVQLRFAQNATVVGCVITIQADSLLTATKVRN